LIEYAWKSGDHPIQVAGDAASFLGEEISLKDFSHDKCQAVTLTGTYSCLRIKFVFEKKA
jgi:hypothetical protein